MAATLQSEHYVTQERVYVCGATPESECDYTREIMKEEREWAEVVRQNKVNDGIRVEKIKRGMIDNLIVR